jgi:hypothetical protein
MKLMKLGEPKVSGRSYIKFSDNQSPRIKLGNEAMSFTD